MNETTEKIKSERDFLWKKCNELYSAITQNGSLNSSTFRIAMNMAGTMFQGKGMDMSFTNSWFQSIASFLEMVETARKQKVGPQ